MKRGWTFFTIVIAALIVSGLYMGYVIIFEQGRLPWETPYVELERRAQSGVDTTIFVYRSEEQVFEKCGYRGAKYRAADGSTVPADFRARGLPPPTDFSCHSGDEGPIDLLFNASPSEGRAG